MLAHWGDTTQPIPADCCGTGPSDIQLNITSEDVEVGNTIFFAPFPQKRDYFFNVTLDQGSDQFQIIDFSYDPATNQATITWTSNPRKAYAVESSTDLVLWIELDDGIAGKEDQTSFGDEPAADTAEIYYRVREVQ